MPKIKKQFDVVIMNPPYNKPPTNGKIGSGNFLWPEFIVLALDVLKDGGRLAAIHPPKWRKPEDKLFPVMTRNNITFLSMHMGRDSLFGDAAVTAADWYVIGKETYQGRTEMATSEGEQISIDLSRYPFIPNGHFETLEKILANGGVTCEILCGQLQKEILAETYDTRRPTISKDKRGKFKYALVNGTGKQGVSYYYCSKKPSPAWLVPKVIFGDANDTGNIVLDETGELGMTQHGIAISISSVSEGRKIVRALESQGWNDFLKSVTYGGFQIPCKMFKYFRRDFWKEFA